MTVAWTRQSLDNHGAVFFRGRVAPRAEEFSALARHGIEVEPQPSGSMAWALRLRHPHWGEADLVCPREPELPPSELLAWDPRLSDEEKAAIHFESVVLVHATVTSGDVLRDRKNLVRYLDAIMGEHGAVAMDHTAQAFWSRAALAEECAHDAELDVSGLFTLHLVQEAASGPVHWLHSHGLKEIGVFDFDLLGPHEDCWGSGYDSLRALAFAILERRMERDGEPFEVVRPGGAVRFVSSRTLRDVGEPGPLSLWLSLLDDEHVKGHAVACEPGSRSWLTFRRRPPQPSRFFAREFPDHALIQFSTDASNLMGTRARHTWAVFRGLFEELREFDLPCLVKIGVVTDGGSPDDREHLWFQVSDPGEDDVEGKLLNRPFHIERLHEGDRGRWPVELLSDWTILTPFGGINPRFMRPLRELRSRPDELRRMLTQGGSGPETAD